MATPRLPSASHPSLTCKLSPSRLPRPISSKPTNSPKARPSPTSPPTSPASPIHTETKQPILSSQTHHAEAHTDPYPYPYPYPATPTTPITPEIMDPWPRNLWDLFGLASLSDDDEHSQSTTRKPVRPLYFSAPYPTPSKRRKEKKGQREKQKLTLGK
ncbi:hypothetical protein B0O99DRAFT_636445 [Bisporella sp. PMI_857]|nr:hypothetical protein B0O99DRAFT_636445 [Bisporella sp. PMI_857]